MKKIMKVGLATMMVLGLVGCGGKTAEKDVLAKIKEKGYIVVGTSPDYAPNEFYAEKNGTREIVGSDISLAKAIAKELGVEMKLETSDFNTVITNVQSGVADLGVAGFAWTEEREKTIKFSESYSQDSDEGWQGLVVRKEMVSKFKNLEDVKKANLKIAAQVGSIQYEMATHLTDKSNIVSLGETNACAAELSVGGIDAFVCSSTQAKAMEKVYNNIQLLPQKEFNLDPENKYDQVCTIMVKDDRSNSLKEVVDKVIEESKENGNLSKWSRDAKKLLPFEVKLDSEDEEELK